MPDYSIDGKHRVKLTDRMTLQPASSLRGIARMPGATSTPAVLGAAPETVEAAKPTLILEDFVPAQPPCELDLSPVSASSPAVLGSMEAVDTEEPSMVEFQPDPEEGAVYAMLHEIQTPDGMVYDMTLPQAGVQGVVLGTAEDTIPGMLYFPVRRRVSGGVPPQTPPGVLGGVGEIVSAVGGGEIVKHVLHIIKAPVEHTLRQVIEAWEGEPSIVPLTPDGTIGEPLTSFEDWRARFDPAREHRILLFIHGFGSNVERSLPTEWVRAFAPNYDAVLGYDHPTLTYDPVQNAAALLQRVPPDVRLNVDIVAHSRGGLVGRSLVELQPASPRLAIQRLITCGAPHAGTLLADQDRWDRLISIGFTAASWLTAFSGAGTVATFVPRALELVLRAGSQFVFDLHGLQVMSPSSAFLQQLNAPSDLEQRVRYATVVSDFNPFHVEQFNYREALTSFATQVFMQTANDLIVPTQSMSSIDKPDSSLLSGRIFESRINHFSYFNQQDIQDFAEAFLTT